MVRLPQQPADLTFFQACRFLGSLGRLTQLRVTKPQTVAALRELTTLTALDICECHDRLDLYFLKDLPRLQQLSLLKCSLLTLEGLQELTRLTAFETEDPATVLPADLLTLTGLKRLELVYDEHDRYSIKTNNADTWASLSALTRLSDNSEGFASWHMLPNLQVLEVFSCPPTLEGVRFPTQLRALSLYTSEDFSGNELHDLSPLSALTALERLHLIGDMMLPLPLLEGLTKLSLSTDLPNASFPDLAGVSNLRALELWYDVPLCLPDLSGLVHLSTIYFNDDMGPLTVDVRASKQFEFVYLSDFYFQ